ncbi:MAG: aspartate carbamoyltransferase catalytic subunit [Planctomycetes bacterium]|nr:aspartate carbamoyltransferase catalytic subunit [Planctomycetota bacterium]
MAWTRKHLLDLEELTAGEIVEILDTAASFKEVSGRSVKKVPALRGKVVVNLFFESSTRTSNSFALAAQRLSADTLSFTSSGSSVSKGETLIDTAKNIEAMGVDAFVIRHSAPGAPHLLARHTACSVVNAGDGCHEHPTQGLLDIFTIREHFMRDQAHKKADPALALKGLTVAILGDIRHSRVARSNAHGLRKLGARVILAGPPTLVPAAIGAALGVETSHDIDYVLQESDVLNCLRIQFERKAGRFFPGVREYAAIYGLNEERMKRAKPEAIIMHPGPINRGIEITPELADGPRSVILHQVENGMAVRMAVLYLCVGANN